MKSLQVLDAERPLPLQALTLSATLPATTPAHIRPNAISLIPCRSTEITASASITDAVSNGQVSRTGGGVCIACAV